ncbi:MAG: class I mannose-6-phosphate isomerase [Anaerolineales bacterium]|nr:class I mannose-6-phosphate isomerase [Anaerolineales bacterium]
MSASSDLPLYSPLTLAPILQTRVWGGRRLATLLGKTLPTADPYGESWELYGESLITNGIHTGKTLNEAIAADPLGMCGEAASPQGDYGLLVKFLDTRAWLSVQVHPDDDWARRLEGEPRGKTECWYVVAAEPEAQIAYGFAKQTDPTGFRTALAEGRAKDLLQFVPVAAGDFIFVPAGTIHALGAGLLIYELQQSSDTTYRLWDWDRLGLDGKPRPLHLEKALQVTNFTPQPTAHSAYQTRAEVDFEVAVLCRSRFFNLTRWTVRGSRFFLESDRKERLLTCLEGQATVNAGAGNPLLIGKGQTVFIPAALQTWGLHGDCTVLVAGR